MELGGVQLDLLKVKVPVYLQSAREDHIAPAHSVFKAVNLFGGPVRFIMAGSGHIAGVINPPAAKKYQYWTNDAGRKTSRAGARARPSIPAPGGRTGTSGCQNCRAPKCLRASPAMANSRPWAMRRGPM